MKRVVVRIKRKNLDQVYGEEEEKLCFWKERKNGRVSTGREGNDHFF